MADNFGGLDIAANVKTALESGGSAKVATGGDPDAIARFMNNATAAYSMAAAQTKVAAQADKDLLAARQANIEQAQAVVGTAGSIGAGVIEQKTAAALDVQTQNIALKQAAGLDLASVLGNSIAEINARTDSGVMKLQQAEAQRDKTLLNTITGKNSVGQWLDAKFRNTPESYEQSALLDARIAQAETKRIQDLQGLYSGQTQVNAAAATTLGVSAAHDMKQLELAKAAKDITAIRETSYALGAEYSKIAQNRIDHQAAAAYQISSMGIQGEIAKKQFAAFAAKTDEPEALAAYVRVALKASGRPDAELWDADRVQAFSKTAAGAAMVQKFAQAGSYLVGHGTISPDQPMPAVFGSPGEAMNTLTELRSTPPGTEKFKSAFDTLLANITADPLSISLKPAQRADRFNAEASNWLENTVKRDVDASPYGQPNLQYVAGMASMNTPEAKAWATKVLGPLASSVKNISAQALWDATVTSGLSLNEQTAGLTAYGVSASVAADALSKPTLLGLPSAQDLPYTATIKGISGIFAGAGKVNFKDAAALRSALFRSRIKTLSAPELLRLEATERGMK